MKNNLRLSGISFLLLGSHFLSAATNLEQFSTKSVEQLTPANGRLVGTLDIRPSDVFKENDSFRFSNSVSIGYRFPYPLQILYQQEIWTNLSNSPALPGPAQGTVFARDGYISVLADKFWIAEDNKAYLTYEARTYLSTFSVRRAAGMISAVRNYLTIGHKLGPGATVSLTETPIMHFFSQDSYKGKANPVFENRLQAKATFQLTQNLTFGLPLIWQVTKMRQSPGASKSGIWDHYIWINPELFYSLDSHYSVGMAYYDLGSLTRGDLSDLTIMEGLRDGVVQFIFKASL